MKHWNTIHEDGAGAPMEGPTPASPILFVAPRRAFAILLAAAMFLLAPSLAAQTVRWNDVPKQSDVWHATPEALRIADNVLLYQQPNGGWAKNIDMARPLSDSEIAELEKSRGKIRTFIDNGATWTQVRFLARVCAAQNVPRIKSGFDRGLDYLLDSQYKNGGWPMIHPPPAEGYYKQITFNDGAIIGVMRLLRDVSTGQDPFAFVDPPHRERAKHAIEKGLGIILKTQVVVNGRRTVWCAQHDRESLLPCLARSYELPSLSGSESVGIVEYLMQLDRPSPEVQRAVNDAVAWFERSKLTGLKVIEKRDPSLPKGYDRVVIEDPAAPPLWARFYDIPSNRPMFVGRDGVVKSRLADIEHERRTGYSYLGTYAQKLLERDYPAWRAKWSGAAGGKWTAGHTTLGTEGSRFTIDDEPAFLLGFSYYGALGASEEFIRRDLDDFQRLGFNWLRVWATWDAFGLSVSAFDLDGRPREPFFSRLKSLVEDCDRRGLIVDITLSRQNTSNPDPAAGQLPNFEAHLRAVESLCTALKDLRNWYLDLGNERDIRDRRHVSTDELKRLRARARELDPARLVTASFGGHDLTAEDVREALVEIGCDFLARHRPRHPKSPAETETQSRACLEAMRAMNRIAPLHDQEPFRRGYTDWQPSAADFLADLRGSIAGGAAGWCFHNGAQRGVPDEQPRRSFDLRTRRLMDQLDSEERQFIEQARSLLEDR